MLRLLRLPYDELDLDISHANRGKRSAVGIHGYYNGGMIFESNHPDDNLLNPIQERVTLPSHWYVAVFKPLMEIGQVFGLAEVEKFATLPPAPEKLRESLQQIARHNSFLLRDAVISKSSLRHFKCITAPVADCLSRFRGAL